MGGIPPRARARSANQTRVSRRALVARLLAAALPSPWVVPATVAASGATPAVADRTAFREVSSYLTGSARLDDAAADRLYASLADDDAGFPAAVLGLRDWIRQKQVSLQQLQDALDRDKSPFAALPRVLATAWFMGIVGEGDKARVLALEHALNAQIVGDVLKPPTYCHGGYASWARAPV